MVAAARGDGRCGDTARGEGDTAARERCEGWKMWFRDERFLGRMNVLADEGRFAGRAGRGNSVATPAR